MTTLTTEDRYAIRELYARYAWARSTADVEAFVELFTPGATVRDEGEQFDGAEGVRTYIDSWVRRRGSAGQQYWIMQQVLEGDAHSCSVRAFLMTPMLNPIGTPSMVYYRFGHLADRLVKDGRTWRLAEHVIEQWCGEVLAGFPDFQMVETATSPVDRTGPGGGGS
ncbi:hypothetical protein GCM10023169_35250 [Georgenia halophila]|uniref:SnoaL-like domain-containing protein n=1 Tax=Georgenia halophila TaxID=620889 RepID=A0ABP8LM81_9MICO